MLHYYQCFGLNICSELPSHLPARNKSDATDVHISIGFVPEQLSSEAPSEHWSQANDKQLLLKIPEIGRFLIENGNSITIAPLGDDLMYLNVFLLGSAMGALLHQRGYLVLHANAIMINHHAVLVAAEQGYGKSTLAAAFLQKGYKILADDVCAINFHNGQPTVYPSYPQIKLCTDAVNALGYCPEHLQPIGYKSDKYYVPVHDQFYSHSLPVSQLIVLDKNDDDKCILEKITGHNKLKTMLQNTYRFLFITQQKMTVQHFNLCNELIKHIPLFKLARPKIGFSAFELVERIITGIITA